MAIRSALNMSLLTPSTRAALGLLSSGVAFNPRHSRPLSTASVTLMRPMIYPEPPDDSPVLGDQSHMSQADIDAVAKAEEKRARKAGRKAVLEGKPANSGPNRQDRSLPFTKAANRAA